MKNNKNKEAIDIFNIGLSINQGKKTELLIATACAYSNLVYISSYRNKMLKVISPSSKL